MAARLVFWFVWMSPYGLSQHSGVYEVLILDMSLSCVRCQHLVVLNFQWFSYSHAHAPCIWWTR